MVDRRRSRASCCLVSAADVAMPEGRGGAEDPSAATFSPAGITEEGGARAVPLFTRKRRLFVYSYSRAAKARSSEPAITAGDESVSRSYSKLLT